MVKEWRDPRARVSVHRSRLGGWRVEVWQQGEVLYSETWDKQPRYKDKQALIRKYEKPIKEEG